MTKSNFKPSRQQHAIFDFIRAGEGDALVRATAGAGKTTTLQQVSTLIPKHMRVCFLAFNKTICAELQKKLPGTKVRTVHSLGHRALSTYLKSKGLGITLDDDKQNHFIDALVEEILEEHPSANKYGTKSFVRSLLNFSRVNCVDLNDPEQLRGCEFLP